MIKLLPKNVKTIGSAALVSASMMLVACSGQVASPYADNNGAPDDDVAQSYAYGEGAYGAFMAGALAQRGDRHEDAVDFYLEVLKRDPSSQLVSERAFAQLLQSGDYENAIKLSRQIIDDTEATPSSLIVTVYQLAALRNGRYEQVRTHLVSTKQGGFGFVLAPILEAWSHAGEGDKDAALLAIEKMASNKAFVSLAKEHKAYLLDYLGDVVEADALYKEIVTSSKLSTFQPVVAYGDFLYRQKRKQEAKIFFIDQLKRFNNNGFLLREARRIDAGIGPTSRAAEPMGAVGLFFFRLASELGQGRSINAAIFYARLSSLSTPDNPDGYIMLGDLLEKVENYTGAAQAFASVGDSSPLAMAAKFRLVEALRQGGDIDAARDHILALLANNADDRNLNVALADLYRGEERYSEALPLYTAVLGDKKPGANDWFILFARGVCYERMGQWAAAEVDMLAALKLKPDDPTILNYLGYSWIDQNVHQDKAKAMIARAVEQRPNDGFIIDSLGWVHYLTGDYSEAVKQLEKAVRLEPSDATINDHLGDAYWQVGRRLEARFQWQYALQSGPEEDERTSIEHKLSYGLDIEQESASEQDS